MADVFISIGGNLGDRLDNQERALVALRDFVKPTALSAIYEAESWGPVRPQGKYYDSVVRGTTSLSPRELLAAANRIEDSLGRERAREIRFGPRTVDLDILLYDDLSIDEPDLIIPHPLILERAFVLVPLMEIAPNLVVKGVPIRKALAHLDDADQVVPVARFRERVARAAGA